MRGRLSDPIGVRMAERVNSRKNAENASTGYDFGGVGYLSELGTGSAFCVYLLELGSVFLVG